MSENEKQQLQDDYTNLEMFCTALETMAEIYGLKPGTMNQLTKDYLQRASRLIKDMNENIQKYKTEVCMKQTLYISGASIYDQINTLNAQRKTEGLPPI